MHVPRFAPLGVFYGTRPQVVKASRITAALARRWPLLTVDTGQHYDYILNGALYDQLGVRAPDVLLEVGSSDHASQTAAVLTRSAAVMAEHQPWAVVVVGDTNSTVGAALAAAKLRIPVIHVEAGLRAEDAMMAEEINRRVVDAISALLCAPSAAAAHRLELEHAGGKIVDTGDVARDVLVHNVSRAPTPATLAKWPVGDAPYAFVTLHRAELTDDAKALREVLGALAALPIPAVFAVHPRTRAAMERQGIQPPGGTLHLVDPLPYLETLGAVRDAAVVVTDSGGVQREAYWLGTPCVTLRGETEWRETVALGANRLVAPRAVAADLGPAVQECVGSPRAGWKRDAYGAGDAAERIAEAIAAWSGRA